MRPQASSTNSLMAWTIKCSLVALWLLNTVRAAPHPIFARSLPAPADDPFYKVPADIARYENGHILDTRIVDIPAAFGPLAAEVVQVKYKYTADFGIADSTLVTIVSPKKPAAGHTRILTSALAEDSSGLACAPSYAISSPTESRQGAYLLPILSVLTALEKGWYVSIPDSEGSRSAWLSLKTEGHAVLDSIRATLAHKKFSQHSTSLVLYGYSGGSRGSGTAAQLASTYAPELSVIKGWVAGGIVADVVAIADALDGTAAAGLNIAGTVGLSNIRPDVRAYYDANLNEKGQQIFKQLRDGDLCAADALTLAGVKFSDLVKSGNPLNQTMLVTALQSEELGPNSPPLTAFPSFLVHNVVDDVVPFAQAQTYVAHEQQSGSRISFARTSIPATSKVTSHGLAYLKAYPSFICGIMANLEEPSALPKVCGPREVYSPRGRCTGRKCNRDTLPVNETSGLAVEGLIGLQAYTLLQAQLAATA